MCLCMVLTFTLSNYKMQNLVRNSHFRDGFLKLRIMPNNTSAFLKPVFPLFGWRCIVLDGLIISWLTDSYVSLGTLFLKNLHGQTWDFEIFVISKTGIQVYSNLADFIWFCLFVLLVWLTFFLTVLRIFL